MSAITPALCLRKAEALSQDGPDYLMVRELIHALTDLVALTQAPGFGETK